MVIALRGGPLDAAVLAVPYDTKWLWVVEHRPVTIETKFAAWPHEDAPTRRPPLPGRLVCYRLSRLGAMGMKAEFSWEPSWTFPEGQTQRRTSA